jgi:hypothetical protein
MLEVHNKDWLNHAIIAVGIIVAIFIVVGMISNIHEIRDAKNPPITQEIKSDCIYCLNTTDNNTQSTVELGTEFTLELPEATYSKDNVLFVENPTGALRKTGFSVSNVPGMWRLHLKAVSKGTTDISIVSNTPSQPDFHTVFIIE